MSALQDAFSSTLSSRYSSSSSRLDNLDSNITNLENRFDREKGEILELIDRRGRELRSMLEAFKIEFEHDRKMRVRREEEMVLQLAAHEAETAGRLEEQERVREERYQAIKVR